MKKIYFVLFISLFVLIGCQNSIKETQETKEIVLYTWEDYIDTSVLDGFEAEFGIKVILKEYAGPDEALASIQSNPESFDVIISYPIAVQELQELGHLEKLDLTKIPNSIHIMDKFRNPEYDINSEYTLPYLWGTTGLAINTDYVPEDSDSWSILWDEKYKGKILLLDDTRESISAVQKYLGFSLNTIDPAEISQMEEAAKKLKLNEVKFGDTFGNIESLTNGEAYIVQVYNGDVAYKAGEKTNIKYILPKEGFEIWVDNFMICANSNNKDEAHALINFLLRPDINARNAEKYSYASPNREAQKYLSKELLENPYVYLSDDVLKKGEYIISLGAATADYKRIFNLMR